MNKLFFVNKIRRFVKLSDANIGQPKYLPTRFKNHFVGPTTQFTELHLKWHKQRKNLFYNGNDTQLCIRHKNGNFCPLHHSSINSEPLTPCKNIPKPQKGRQRVRCSTLGASAMCTVGQKPHICSKTFKSFKHFRF